MSTHREQVLRKLGLPRDTHLGLEELAELTDLPLAALKEVHRRGVGAWRSNPQSVRLKSDYSKNPNMRRFPRSARLGPQQWGLARVYSFINGGPTSRTADADIVREYGLGIR